ncbi:peptide-methionine (S)-S-oxide reductase MsrA [Alphaproteobacteria bacterium]|nr:peptide-methionine (S)-S-oxide reductase MsrA [Alphaproteobacteria bacterium]
MTKALIGAGCFWGIEEYFRKQIGVINTKVGYSGGKAAEPSYEEVCTGKTGHAEVVQIKFDENLISFTEILNHFWKCHDPTQLNRQGFDVGTQYRSVIFYYSNEQHNDAMESKKQTQNTLQRTIVTEIMPAQEFYLAENYHQLYLYKRE